MSEESSSPIRLPAGEVHLWYGDPAELAADAMMADCRRLLSPAELKSCARFAQERSRQLYLAAHALLRRVLSHYAAIAPAQWQFTVGAYGKPALAKPLPEDALHFNLTHTTGMVACAVCRDCELGVDAESVERRVELQALAKRFFSPLEADELACFPAAGRQQRFYQYWTLKESYIKARGAGLSIPLDSFSMLLANSEATAASQLQSSPHKALPPATITFHRDATTATQLSEDPIAWQFGQYLPTTNHVLALAIRKGELPEQRVVLRRATQPFISEGHWSENANAE
jgi:4'-phosphopantetheinyl transferase